jgi:acetyl esterase/lipase
MESRSGNARWRGPLICPNAIHAKERKHVSQDQEAGGSPLLVSASTLSAAPAAVQDLDPSTQAFVDGLRRSRPIYTLAPDAARAVLSDVQKSTKVTLPEVLREARVLQVGSDGTTNIRMVSPAGASGKLPVIVYIHGGGWVLGDKETHDRLIREFAVGANAIVAFIDYDRSPESRYPTAIEQGYAVAKYVAEHADEFGADLNRLAIAGDRVGGNMAGCRRADGEGAQGSQVHRPAAVLSGHRRVDVDRVLQGIR